MAKLPKLDDLLKDPKHEETRTLLGGFVRAEIEKMIEERKDKRVKKSDSNLFDQIFGGGEDEDE